MTDHTMSIQQQMEKFGTNPKKGLTGRQAAESLSSYGENRLEGKPRKTYLQKFVDQLKNYMVFILLAAAVISFFVALFSAEGDFIDSIIIIAIVVLNGVLGVRQESQAEKALESLQELSAPTARVLRDGDDQIIPAAQVVPGDIVLLEAGDLIPADGRIIKGASLQCDESVLTGESLPVQKDGAAKVPEVSPLGDRLNMVFAGCTVTYGRGRVLVTRTGMETEMGKIAELLEGGPPPLTPLQQKLNGIGKVLGLAAIGICVFIFLLGLIQGIPLMTILMTSISLAVAAVPEGLTAVVTVVLALGVQRMVRKNAIIRRLPAVETLGSATVICSDKTGTLTQNRMTVRKVWPAGSPVEVMSSEMTSKAGQVLQLAMLCNDGKVEIVDGVPRHIGDPTETAIVAAAREIGMYKAEADKQFPRAAEIPFDSGRKLMTTVHQIGGRVISITKGGYDVLLPRCTAGPRERAAEVNADMADGALRVLAVAFRELTAPPSAITSEELERDLTFVGLIGMIDPPREESAAAVALCHQAGIKTVMITGDHISTASAIATQLGILEHEDQAISGSELARIPDPTLVQQVDRYRVYARVSPEDKIRIVKAWQQIGHVVAMTGDGVNDAPALKAADIGCAMGVTGTDVAKGAADMILTDDNFATIVDAVREGRGIYDNIKRTILFLLSCNLGEVFVVFLAMILGWGTPLLAIHLLLINVITDALPALALGVEPTDPDLMNRKPIPREQGFFSGGFGLSVGLQGVMVGLITLVGYAIGRFADLSPLFPSSPEAGMTMAFLVLAISQLVQAFNCRSSKSLFRVGILSNKSMLKAFGLSLAAVLLICLVPPLESLFKMVDLSMLHWLWVLVLSIAPLLFVEAGKGVLYLRARRQSKQEM